MQLCRVPSQVEAMQAMKPMEPLQLAPALQVIGPQTLPDDKIIATSHALAPQVVERPEIIPVPDDDSSIIDNSDGLNVLSDPRKPSAGARRQPAASTLPAPRHNEPITYPLTSLKTLQHCSGCGPCPQPYSICATDIPSNGLSIVCHQRLSQLTVYIHRGIA